jgi:hypothetical protein
MYNSFLCVMYCIVCGVDGTVPHQADDRLYLPNLTAAYLATGRRFGHPDLQLPKARSRSLCMLVYYSGSPTLLCPSEWHVRVAWSVGRKSGNVVLRMTLARFPTFASLYAWSRAHYQELSRINFFCVQCLSLA